METIFTYKHQLILAMSIGDGHITKRNTLTITHCEKQLGYLKHKRDLLIQAGIKCWNIQKVNNNGFTAYKFEVPECNEIKDIRHILYTPTKTLTYDVLKHLTPQGIALWYLDDGGLSKGYRDGVLFKNELMLNTGLSKEENQIIIDWFKSEYDIQFSQCKNHNCYRLRCGTKEARRVMDIIYPFCYPVDCLKYKIDVKDYKYCMQAQVSRSAEGSETNQDIVSTSTETQSSLNKAGED